MQACNHTCRSLSGPDPRCGLDDAPVEGCGCPEGTRLNQGYMCTPKAECFCHYYGGTTPPGRLVIDGRQWWADYLSFYSHLKSWNLISQLCTGVFCFPCNLFPIVCPHLPFALILQICHPAYCVSCSFCENGELHCSRDCGNFNLFLHKWLCVKLFII